MLQSKENTTLVANLMDDLPGITCEFFGTRILYRAPDTFTLQRISYIFDRFVDPQGVEPDIEFALLAEGQGSFVRAILTPSLDANVYYRYRGKDSWTLWSYQDTPFPPLQIQPFRGRFLVLHGCAVVTSSGTALAFIAPSMSGKTTLLMKLCQRGYSALCDDLLFIDPTLGQIALYRKPVGIRESTLPLFPGLANSAVLQRALCFGEYGTSPQTWLVHLDELIPHCYHTIPWAMLQGCVILNRSGTGRIEHIRPAEALLRILPQVISSGLDVADTLKYVIALLGRISVSDLDVTNLDRACDQVEQLETSSVYTQENYSG